MLTSAEYFWGFSNAATKESRSSGIVSFVFADLAVLVLAVAAEKKLLKVLILLAKIHPSFASVQVEGSILQSFLKRMKKVLIWVKRKRRTWTKVVEEPKTKRPIHYTTYIRLPLTKNQDYFPVKSLLF